MKKCPFCGEEIKEDAVESNIGGELLCTSGPGTGSDGTRDKPNKDDNKILMERDGEARRLQGGSIKQKGNIKHREIYVPKRALRRPGKYGWGWLAWLGLFLIGIKDFSFSDGTLNFIALAIPLASLFPYFALRRRFLMKRGFPGSRPWAAGLSAALVVCPLSIALFSALFSLDGLLLNHKIQSVEAKYRERVAALKQDETKHEARFVDKPGRAKLVRQNVKTIDEILARNKDKQRLFHEMFDDYKKALKGKRSKTDRKPFEQSIDTILSSYDASCEKWRKSLTLLRSHYLTGKKKYYQGYENAREDAAQSATDVQKGIRETFGTTSISLAE